MIHLFSQMFRTQGQSLRSYPMSIAVRDGSLAELRDVTSIVVSCFCVMLVVLSVWTVPSECIGSHDRRFPFIRISRGLPLLSWVYLIIPPVEVKVPNLVWWASSESLITWAPLCVIACLVDSCVEHFNYRYAPASISGYVATCNLPDRV